MSKFVEMTFQIAMSVPLCFSSFASQIVQIKKQELPLIKLSKVISEAISFVLFLGDSDSTRQKLRLRIDAHCNS